MPSALLNRTRPVAYGVILVAAAALGSSAVLLVRSGVPAGAAVLGATAPSILLGAIGGASRFLCRAIPLRSSNPLRLLGTHAISAAAAAGIWVALLNGSFAGPKPPVHVDAPILLTIGIVIYGVAVTIHYLLLEAEASREAEQAALRYQILAREAELRAFKAQVDPHFLFNSLNAVASLCGTNPQQARETAQRLADFFRMMLRVGKLDRITLSEELELVSRYLAIEQVRFGPRLTIRKEIGDGAGSCNVPPLLLQPLVENAVRHGIASLIDGGEVVIGATTEASELRIWIENPADPEREPARGEGIGLQNARGRLRTAFGPGASLRTTESGGTFRVDLELPR